MRFNNQTIYYETYGEGFPLVFLHGFCEDSSLWQMYVEPFKSKYRIILIDLMGFGQSDTPKEATINYLAKAIKAVLEELKIEQCLMVGHSMGGYTILAFAELFPSFLSGICLFHSHPFADSEDKKRHRKKTIAFIKKHGSRPFLKQMISGLFNEKFKKENPTVINQMIDKAALYNEDGIISGLEAMINRPDRSAILAQIEVPILMIIGKKDVVVPYADSLKMSHLPKLATVEILENVAHVGMLEVTEITQNLLLNFINFVQQFSKK